MFVYTDENLGKPTDSDTSCQCVMQSIDNIFDHVWVVPVSFRYSTLFV